ncbi:hypothetical protein C8R44DRAFT_869062 [Mycena epipterygia]|nr:hypothetical protein C8R44DRAFT_869062 [Mycena epipterygia]
MKISTAFFALVPLIAALPPALRTAPGSIEVAKANAMISSRTQAGAFVCTDAGFTGSCAVFNALSGQCINLPANFIADISSVGPDAGQECFFFMQVLVKDDIDCTGESLGPIRTPGITDLNVAATVAFNDHISSFQ